MTRQKNETGSTAIDGEKLWDEILKAIVSAMPSQLFPLFKEVYGKEYPKDTQIIVLGSETSSFMEDGADPPTSTLMDISLLVAGTDYYHLECQMKNEKEMVIRMFAYDVRFAITHTKFMNDNTGEITLYFPCSVVIYPEQNNAIPEHLQCRVVFQDGSEHIYKVPTVKVQTYSLEEIRRKHLTLFIPYTILRLRPRLKPNIGQKLTEKELTEFVEEVILVLKKELIDGNLTEREYSDYIRLFWLATDRVLARHSQMREEVKHMTEPLIILPSMIEDEVRTEVRTILTADLKLSVEETNELTDALTPVLAFKVSERLTDELNAKDGAGYRAKYKDTLAEKNAAIRRLQEKIRRLREKGALDTEE